MIGKLKKLLKREGPCEVEVTIGGHSFIFTGNVTSRPFTRAGRISFRAMHNGKEVKVYEAASKEQANFIRDITSGPLKAHFPECLFTHEQFVITEWVQGDPLTWERLNESKRLFEQTAAFQAKVHKAMATEKSGFDYVAFLIDRVARYQSFDLISQTLNSVLRLLKACKNHSMVRLAHPDFTPGNLLVRESSAEIVIVDNELLATSGFWGLDVLNTINSMNTRNRGVLSCSYLRYYQEAGGDLGSLRGDLLLLWSIWQLRKIGGLFQNGETVKALKSAEAYLKGSAESDEMYNTINNYAHI